MARKTSYQKVTVTLPKELLAQLDQIIPSRQRSNFIAEAVERQLAILNQQEAIEEAAGLWTDEAYPNLQTEADMDQWLGDIRQLWGNDV